MINQTFRQDMRGRRDECLNEIYGQTYELEDYSTPYVNPQLNRTCQPDGRIGDAYTAQWRRPRDPVMNLAYNSYDIACCDVQHHYIARIRARKQTVEYGFDEYKRRRWGMFGETR